MKDLLIYLATAIAIWAGGNCARAQTSDNPLLLWDVSVQEPDAAPIITTIPIPANGGTNSVNTALGTLTLTTTRTSATVSLTNFHVVVTQPNQVLLPNQLAADCIGASTNNSSVAINSSQSVLHIAQILNTQSTCTVTATTSGPTGTRFPVNFVGTVSGSTASTNSVGTVTLTQGTATIEHSGVQFQPAAGQVVAIGLGDKIITGSNGGAQIQFTDQTVYTLSPNSDLAIDDFGFDQTTRIGRLKTSFMRGFFRWKTGLLSGSDLKVNSIVAQDGIRGTDFTVNVARSGNTITSTTTVSSGTVTQTDVQGNTTTLTAGQTGQASAPAPTLVASVLPLSRSVVTTAPATAFAAIANAGPSNALACTISAPQSPPTLFSYQTTDPATNMPTGTPNTPMDIPPGSTQTFVITLAPTAEFNATNVQLTYTCNDADTVASLPGINSLLLSASDRPVPDVVALAATTQNDGILHINGAGGTGAFAVATVNVGAGSRIIATANTGSANLPLALTLCQTNPQTSQCLAPPAASVTTTINANATPTFAIFGSASGAIAFDPAHSRIFVQFADANGAERGATSVAVQTQ